MINRASLSLLKRIDWDFAGDFSESKFSAVHWYPARFASQIPAALIGVLSDRGQTVLDPFVGSGTTLVEAQRLARRGIGLDISPIACLVTEAKILAYTAVEVERIADRVRSRAHAALEDVLTAPDARHAAPALPASIQLKKWYTPSVARDLSRLWNCLQGLVAPHDVLARAAFSAILLSVCRETRHWGYVCDNSTPVGSHGGDVFREFVSVLGRLVGAYQERDAELHARDPKDPAAPASEVQCGDATQLLDLLEAHSVDLVVTSPPYYGVCDYIKAQRLSMEWFGADIEPLRLREIGARSKRHRLTSLKDYATELSTVFKKLRRVLRRGGALALIIGQSSQRDRALPIVRRSLEETGFTVHVDINRRVSSQRRQAPSIRGEHLLVLS